MMQCSHDAESMVCFFEGYKSTAYNRDGRWTIGYGHTHGVRPGWICTIEQAREWFEQDMQLAEMCVAHLVNVPLTQGQFDALCSWTYNLGAGRLQKSTMLRKLNAGEYDRACAELTKWVWGVDPDDPKKERKIVLKGLVTRRNWEAELWRAQRIVGVAS